jgi:CheY-like chemotaxis protein
MPDQYNWLIEYSDQSDLMATLLIVDDDPFILETASMMLELAGYEVLRAESGQAALRLCAEVHGPIHLLLTDIEMPLMNGPELAARLFNLIPHIAIVFMTAHHGQLRMPGQDAFGGYGIIRKPFTAAQLRQEMVSRLAKNQEFGRRPMWLSGAAATTPFPAGDAPCQLPSGIAYDVDSKGDGWRLKS